MKRTKAQRHNLHIFGAQKVKFQLLYLCVLHLNIVCGIHHRLRACLALNSKVQLEKHQVCDKLCDLLLTSSISVFSGEIKKNECQ